jgi:hypothetical protein
LAGATGAVRHSMEQRSITRRGRGAAEEIAGGNVPRWAAKVRAMEPRKDGIQLKLLT